MFRKFLEGIFDNYELDDIKRSMHIRDYSDVSKGKLYDYFYQQIEKIFSRITVITYKSSRGEIDDTRLKLFVLKKSVQTFEKDIKSNLLEEEIKIIDRYIGYLEKLEKNWCYANSANKI